MNNFIYQNPTKILFGKGMVDLIAKEISSFGCKNVLLLYGKNSIKENGLYTRVTDLLKKENIRFTEHPGVKANPVLSHVKEGIDKCRKESVDAILAVGGGSVIDSAKAIGRGVYYDGDAWDLFSKKVNSPDSLPIFTILTLSATGSEMNANSVVTKEDELKKWAMSGSIASYPKVSVIDPEVQMSLPPIQTINGAADTLAHVFEYYFDGTENAELNDEFAEGIIRNVMKQIKILVKDPLNYQARAELAWSSTNALNNLLACGRNGGDWATHNIEHSVSAYFDVAHGTGLAILFPAWMKYVYKENPARFAKFAERVFGIKESDELTAAEKGIAALENFFKEIGAPTTLSGLGITKEDFDKMADNASLRGPVGKFKKLERNDIYKIYELAL